MNPRWYAFGVVLGGYLAAFGAALATVRAWSGGPTLLATLLADVAATLVVYLCAMAFGNASLYDPYWSVAPPLIALSWLRTSGDRVRQVLVLALIVAWAARLTVHWGRGWRGLDHEDWRYRQLREQNRGRLPWWLLSLTGIMLMPTLVVYLAMLPVWPALTGRARFGVLDVLATAVTAAAIAVETVADAQMVRFVRVPGNRARSIDVGLWRLCRHPNYLGEIGFWWGLWLFGLAGGVSWWWTVVGAMVMVGLFVFVSVPLMDARSLARRPDYASRMATLPALLPRFGG